MLQVSSLDPDSDPEDLITPGVGAGQAGGVGQIGFSTVLLGPFPSTISNSVLP